MLVVIQRNFLEAEKLCFHYAATADASADTVKGWDAKRGIHTVTALYICRGPWNIYLFAITNLKISTVLL
jgi:hypothetical protein